MNYKAELTEIVRLRKEAYSPDLPIIIAIALGAGNTYVFPVLTPAFGIIAGFLFYKKIIKAAHAPCPRCKQPYGTSSKWPIGVGANQYQNCDLELYENAL